MKTWDTIVVGGGIIGLSLALELRRHGATVLVVDRAEPGREASYAAAGMIACCERFESDALQELASTSARMYPEYIHDLEDESGMRADYRRDGTIALIDEDHELACDVGNLSAENVRTLEPCLCCPEAARVVALPEASVDPRALVGAAVKAAKHRGIDVATGAEVLEIEAGNIGVTGVRTSKTTFTAATVVNCAGAWACRIGPHHFPTRPVKGQMLCVTSIAGEGPLEHSATVRIGLRHVVRTPQVYLVPRSDGRILIGATVEETGYDKRVLPETVQHLHRAAAELVPKIAKAKILESWAGLRPGTPDNLPMLGATDVPGYFVAAGHFRDGILLAPVTARAMARVISGEQCGFDLTSFSPLRFAQRQ